MSNKLDERLDDIEIRIEKLEKLYGIKQLGIDSHHTMVIYWSSVDFCYLVALPECRGHVMNWQNVTHGDTYEEAARNGTEALHVILEDETTPGD